MVDGSAGRTDARVDGTGDTGCSPASCEGGCCQGGACVHDDSPSACGTTGVACAICTGETPSCIDGMCRASCDAGSCAAGTCCVSGSPSVCKISSRTACGSKAPCTDCTGNSQGTQCLEAGVCGCLTYGDCPIGNACNDGVCSSTCSTDSPCHGGCCNGTQCQPGIFPNACGPPQGACVACATMNGSACLTGGICGCSEAKDCNPLYACVDHSCDAGCDPSSAPCNGGCCNEAHMCTTGTETNSCGSNGTACLKCGVTCKPGAACITTSDRRTCGCDMSSQCQASACGAMQTCTAHACTN
jgi:hypothetical protein